MEIAEVKDGYELKIGDMVIIDNPWVKRTYKIHRVTKIYAFAKCNNVSEVKFPKIYNSFHFSSIPRNTWDTNSYRVVSK